MSRFTFLLCWCVFIGTATATAARAMPADTLQSAITTLSPAEAGLLIAREADARDKGFSDFTVEMEMVLRNAQGQESLRRLTTRALEDTTPGHGDKGHIIFSQPRDIAGTALLTHARAEGSDDQWLYLPSLKRVKRIASDNRTGSFVGSEFAYEDIADQIIEKYRYAYLDLEACPSGDAMGAALQCYKVERIPKAADSGYTRQILWLDTAELRLWKAEYYDRRNALLKTLETADYRLYLNTYWRPQRLLMTNVQTRKSTALNYQPYRFRTGLKDIDFSPSRLETGP